ncbi:MAG TPA: DUF3710 domain-containing protein [Marmoricola sp.]|nr:DUF3710 domain-containing protein [Marmoricola sp.]
MRRRRKEAPGEALPEPLADQAADPASDPAPDPGEPGPRDVAEVDLSDGGYADLGSLLISPPEGMDLQLQVDEASGEVLAVLLANEEGAVELRAFAAARNSDLWSDARREIAADAARRGGTATEQEGPLGPELAVMIPVTTPDGQSAVQPSRVLGHNGPRWFLRATVLGRPAVEPDSAGPWEDAIRAVVVRRGAQAMPPGEPLPLQLPPDAERV